MDASLADVPSGSYTLIMQIAGFFILLPFSMLFSATETAMVSLSDTDLEQLKTSGKKKERNIYRLMSERSEFMLITLLLGNTLVNISIATISALITYNLFDGSDMVILSMFFQVIIVGIIILLFGEIIPKSYSIRNKIIFINRFFGIIMFFYYLIYPLTFIVEKLVNIFIGHLKNIDTIAKYSRKDIENLMEAGGEEGVLEEDEKNMINSIFEFGETTAKEVMVPRVDMMSIPEDITITGLIEFINENSFSRIPVYKESIDNIIGILYIKDLLHHLKTLDEKLKISKIVRDVNFIPESKDIATLLKMFQKEKIHIAIVVDEYGGTSGMITLEDIIEEIVGEIQDEFDQEEKLHKKIGENSYEFDAKTPIDDLNDIINVDLPEDEDYESLGGYLYDLFGEVPEVGDKKKHKGYMFTIQSLKKQRIGWVKIEKMNDENEKE